jgi:hypothetical protein
MSRRPSKKLLASVFVVVGVIALANMRTTTMRGVNYVVTARSLPLYVKTLDFVDRDVNYRHLAAQVTNGAATDDAKLRAVFDWTVANIRPTPPGFPVVDDHVWHIIVRGYGQDDQQADVFTTLLEYAGVPAYWIFIGPKPELTLSLARVGGQWRAIDVTNHVMFKNTSGSLASAEELAADPALAVRQGPPMHLGLAYARFFDGFRAPEAPDVTHAAMQRPVSRAWYEVRRLAGGGGRPWEMRPASRMAASR